MATIRDLLGEMRDLYRSEPNPERRQKLQDAYDVALNAALEMTDKDISASTQDYKKALDKLDESIKELKEARRKILDVEKAIGKAAKAASLLGKVAKTVISAGV